MIIFDTTQGSPEWIACRCGVPSASNFDKIITTNGALSKQRTKYLYRLAGEKITGACEETYQNAAMQRGIELEEEARQAYELITRSSVEQVGFIYHDERQDRGCSPDGLVDDGGLEIKCPSIAVHVEYLLGGKLPTDYFQQVQGSMYITGREWWDFMSYYPGMKSLIVRVARDNAFCKHLGAELDIFCAELRQIVEQIK